MGCGGFPLRSKAAASVGFEGCPVPPGALRGPLRGASRFRRPEIRRKKDIFSVALVSHLLMNSLHSPPLFSTHLARVGFEGCPVPPGAAARGKSFSET